MTSNDKKCKGHRFSHNSHVEPSRFFDCIRINRATADACYRNVHVNSIPTLCTRVFLPGDWHTVDTSEYS